MTCRKKFRRRKTTSRTPLAGLNPPGSFVLAENRIELERILGQLLRQELACEVWKPDGTMLGGGPLPVAIPGAQDEWSVDADPAIYKLRVVADRTYETDIDLRKGDRLLVRLVGDGNTIRFKRILYSDDFRTRVEQEQAGWRFSNLVSSIDKQGDTGRLTLFSSLEKKPNDGEAEAALHQIYPGLAWFKLDGQNLQHPEELFTTRWRARRLFPSPVWQLDVRRWPEDPARNGAAVPKLTAWWLDPGQKPSPDAIFQVKSGLKPSDFPARVRLDNDTTIDIEGIDIEKHRVEVEPGQWKDNTSCLVVRLGYPRGKPCFIDPEDLTGIVPAPTGYEHRFFSRASKYTGLFWDVNPDQLEKLKSLSLISLKNIRQLAEKQGTTAVLEKLPAIEGGVLPRPQ